MATEAVPPPRPAQPEGPEEAGVPAGPGAPREQRPALELLVHGVGGATGQDMLGDARTVRVTGDDTAAIHRRTEDAEDRPWDDRAPLREAYSWSNLTSGNGARALWLLLLPFMIANVAHWMRPALRGHGRTHRAYDICTRLIALSLTVLLISGACVIALDLFAWQCLAAAECAAQGSWSGFLTDGWWAAPGRRLALAAALPVALIVLLWWLSHRTWSTYESAYPPPRQRDGSQQRAPLELPGFWYGRGLGSRLRAAHAAAGLLTVAGALLAAGWSADHGPGGGGGALAATGWLLLAGWLALAAAAVGEVVRAGRGELMTEAEPSPAVTALPAAAGGLLLLALAHTAWSRTGWEAAGTHPGASVFAVLTVLQGALIAGLALAALRLHRFAPAADRTVLRGLGGPCVALLACALAGVLTSGAAQRVADWLGPASGRLPGPPVLLSWQAAVIPALLVVLLVVGLIAGLRVAAERRRLEPEVLQRYPGERCPPYSTRSARVAGAEARAKLTDRAPALTGTVVVVSLLLGTGAVAGAWLTGQTPRDATESAPALIAGFAALSESAGSWLTGLGVLIVIAVGRRAYRDPAARRTIGILWDVGTFWPRAAHPFAPPCYAERAVPDLSWRIATWIDRTGGRVLLSGHSQGSVLAAAAVWQLDPATRSHVALLTHGSPLARLYGRWFPKYFGPQALSLLHRDMPCWRNLWRATDPIGGPVHVGGPGPAVDCGPLRDPRHYARNLLTPLPDPLLGHGEYAADPAYARERAVLAGRLRRDGGESGGPEPAAEAERQREPGPPGAGRPGAGRPGGGSAAASAPGC